VSAAVCSICPETAAIDLCGGRHGQQTHDRHRQGTFDLEIVAAVRTAIAEAGIGQATSLYQFGFGDAEFAVRSLQRAIVDQSNMHGRFRAEWRA